MANSQMDKFEEDVKKLEAILETQQHAWDKTIADYTKSLKGDIKQLHITDADATNGRQLVSAEIRKYSLMIHKTNITKKQLVKKQWEYYTISYQVPVKSSGDKMKLIEADIRLIDYKIDVLDAHISFLRDTGDNLKQMGYSVKNRIELLNILGLD